MPLHTTDIYSLINVGALNSVSLYQGRIQDFLRGGLNIEMISEAVIWGHSPPEATGCFINIPPKLCLMQDLEHIYVNKYKEVLKQIWSRGCGGCNP